MAPTRAITYGAFSPRAMSSPSLRLRRGPQDPGAATPSRSPPRGPFVLPQDRPPRRPRGSAASDASADADPGEQWCGWMCRLCTYKEAPEWSVHNKYIHTGYRTGFGWRAAVRSVRVPPDPAPARSLSSLRRASTSRSRVSPSPSVFGIVPSAPGVPASPSRALVSIPRSPADARPRALAPSVPRAQVLMVHNETCNIWTHLVGLAIFVAITVTMATGWGAHHMPALPDTWVTGTNATRAALVARTVRFRLGVEGSRAALSNLAAQLRDGSHLFEWTHANPYPRPEHGERDEDDGGDRRAPNVGSPPLERDASDAEGWNGGGADDAEGNDDGATNVLRPRPLLPRRFTRARRWAARRTRCWRWRTDFYIIFTRPTPRCCRTRATRSRRRWRRRAARLVASLWRWNPPQVGWRTRR